MTVFGENFFLKIKNKLGPNLYQAKSGVISFGGGKGFEKLKVVQKWVRMA